MKLCRPNTTVSAFVVVLYSIIHTATPSYLLCLIVSMTEPSVACLEALHVRFNIILSLIIIIIIFSFIIFCIIIYKLLLLLLLFISFSFFIIAIAFRNRGEFCDGAVWTASGGSGLVSHPRLWLCGLHCFFRWLFWSSLRKSSAARHRAWWWLELEGGGLLMRRRKWL